MRLGLFFTNGVSLRTWQKVGNLDREIKPYLKMNADVYFLTYGKNEPEIKGIKVLPATCLNKEFKKIDVFKTNQMNGSLKAVIAKKIYGKKLVIRQGYQWSIFAKNKGVALWKRIVINLIERIAYKNADAIMVSSKADINYIIDRYKIKPDKVYYVPNYIDTELFRPMNLEKENRIITVAKLEKQKNLENLIEAVRGLDVKLTIIGQGSLEKKLKEMTSVDVKFVSNLDNKDLPTEINRSKLFVLPSNFEGCPKALLEAMSCGVTVVGSNVEGIKEVINNGQNGYLCNTNVNSIREVIVSALNNPINGRETIINNFSLEKLLEREKKIYDKILQA